MNMGWHPVIRWIGIPLLFLAAALARAGEAAPPAADVHSSGPIEGCADGSANTGFWNRLGESYKKHLYPENQPAAAAADPNAPFDEQATERISRPRPCRTRRGRTRYGMKAGRS